MCVFIIQYSSSIRKVKQRDRPRQNLRTSAEVSNDVVDGAKNSNVNKC